MRTELGETQCGCLSYIWGSLWKELGLGVPHTAWIFDPPAVIQNGTSSFRLAFWSTSVPQCARCSSCMSLGCPYRSFSASESTCGNISTCIQAHVMSSSWASVAFLYFWSSSALCIPPHFGDDGGDPQKKKKTNPQNHNHSFARADTSSTSSEALNVTWCCASCHGCKFLQCICNIKIGDIS